MEGLHGSRNDPGFETKGSIPTLPLPALLPPERHLTWLNLLSQLQNGNSDHFPLCKNFTDYKTLCYLSFSSLRMERPCQVDRSGFI
jgi:hypothetical protein